MVAKDFQVENTSTLTMNLDFRVLFDCQNFKAKGGIRNRWCHIIIFPWRGLYTGLYQFPDRRHLQKCHPRNSSLPTKDFTSKNLWTCATWVSFVGSKLIYIFVTLLSWLFFVTVFAAATLDPSHWMIHGIARLLGEIFMYPGPRDTTLEDWHRKWAPERARWWRMDSDDWWHPTGS